MAEQRLKILFLCTGNSCRSQMAEGWARALQADVIEAYSAGIETHGLNPNAVAVMAEAGVDISGHVSKDVADLKDVGFDFVVTVCGHAHETCPVFFGNAQVVHAGFDDPPKLAAGAETEDEALGHYRRVRDEIRGFVARIAGAFEWLGSGKWVCLIGSEFEEKTPHPNPLPGSRGEGTGGAALAAGAETEDEALGHYRRVRDEIRGFVAGLPERLNG
jgi:arsenate reductase (thioredoxin)